MGEFGGSPAILLWGAGGGGASPVQDKLYIRSLKICGDRVLLVGHVVDFLAATGGAFGLGHRGLCWSLHGAPASRSALRSI